MLPESQSPRTDFHPVDRRDLLADQLHQILQIAGAIKTTVAGIQKDEGKPSAYLELVDRLSEVQSEVWRIEDPRRPRQRFPETIDFAEHPTENPPFRNDTEGGGRLFGTYVLKEELGRGGMGIVFKAFDRRLNRHVAIKIVVSGERATETVLYQFEEEAAAAATLEHPNIVAVHDVGEVKGVAYIVMQLIEGETLAQRLCRGRMPIRDVVAFLGILARAMGKAHEAGILHLDLKPSNILLDKKLQPHITDFGLARPFSKKHPTLSGGIAGTPKYMAPERAAGTEQALTPATDVFSLGAILYEMLCGQPCFQASNLREMVTQLLLHEPPPLRSVNHEIDQELEAICAKCLAKNPAQRYQSANQLADDLDNYLRGEATSVEPARLHFKVSRLFRTTHHAEVLKKWGALWMMHSGHVLVLCLLTQMMATRSNLPGWSLLALWGSMETLWAILLYARRARMGKITAVERVLNHVWLAGGLGNLIVFFAEWYAGLPPLSLAYCLALVCCCIFLIKAGLLSGKFYFVVATFFACTCAMMMFPDVAMLIFGLVASVCFLIPGYLYYRLSQERPATPAGVEDSPSSE